MNNASLVGVGYTQTLRPGMSTSLKSPALSAYMWETCIVIVYGVGTFQCIHTVSAALWLILCQHHFT